MAGKVEVWESAMLWKDEERNVSRREHQSVKCLRNVEWKVSIGFSNVEVPVLLANDEVCHMLYAHILCIGLCIVCVYIGVLDYLATEIWGKGYIFSFRGPSSHPPGMWLLSPPVDGIKCRSSYQHVSVLQFGDFPRMLSIIEERIACKQPFSFSSPPLRHSRIFCGGH